MTLTETPQRTRRGPVVVHGKVVVRRRVRWWPSIVATLALLFAAELGVRAIEDRLPPASGWISEEYTAKRDQMEHLAAEGGAGVVLLGSSVAGVSVDPDRLSEAATGSRGAYNAGLIGATPSIVSTWGLELVVPTLRPDTVVVALSSRDLNGNGAGMRNQDERFRGSQGGQWLLGTQSLADRAEWWLNEHSALVRQRQSVRRPLEALAGYDAPDRNLIELTDRGLATQLLGERYRNGPGALEFFRREPLRDFAITDDQLGAARRLVSSLEGAGVRVIVLDVPVTADYAPQHPGGEADMAAYRAAVDELASEAGAEVLRPGTWPAELFSDPLHLNGAGVERLSAELDGYLRQPEAGG